MDVFLVLVWVDALYYGVTYRFIDVYRTCRNAFMNSPESKSHDGAMAVRDFDLTHPTRQLVIENILVGSTGCSIVRVLTYASLRASIQCLIQPTHVGL